MNPFTRPSGQEENFVPNPVNEPDTFRDPVPRTTTADTSHSRLFNLVEQQKWDEVKQVLSSPSYPLQDYLSYYGGKDKSTPLQVSFKYKAPYDVIEKMISVGGDRIVLAYDDDVEKRTSLHYACRDGASAKVIKLLLDYGGRNLAMQRTCDSRQWTALHYACNRGSSIEVLDALVNYKDYGVHSLLSKGPDSEDLLPIGTFIQLNKGKMNELRPEMLYLQKLYLKHCPDAIPSCFASTLKVIIQNPMEDQVEIVKGPFIKKVLNEKYIKPFNLAVLFMDLAMHINIMISLSYFIETAVRVPDVNAALLALSFTWFALREILQITSSSFYSYAFDRSNYVDWVQLGFIFTIFLHRLDGPEKTLLLLATGVSWLRLLFVCANFIHNVAVFVTGLLSILKKLVPFLYVSINVTMAFAHMYHIAGPPNGITCPEDPNNDLSDEDYEDGGWTCSISSCYFKTFSMLLSGDWVFIEKPDGALSTLSLTYSFVIGILLLNILIAVLSNQWNEVQENGDRTFWLSRLRFVDELEGIRQLILSDEEDAYVTGKRDDDNFCPPHQSPDRMLFSTWDQSGYDRWEPYSDECKRFIRWYAWREEESYGVGKEPSLNKRLYMFFKMAKWQELFPPSKGFRHCLMGVQLDGTFREKFRFSSKPMVLLAHVIGFGLLGLSVLITPFVILGGLVTGGKLWPRGFKQFLFDGPTKLKKEEEEEDISDENTLDPKEVDMRLSNLEKKMEEVLNLLYEMKKHQ